jgi:polysaccharide biosynthesis protein PslH
LPRSKILFVSYSGPLPLTDGKRQRTHALLKALEERYIIDFLIINNDPEYRLAISEYKSSSVTFLFYNQKSSGWAAWVRKKLGLIFTPDSDLKAYIRRLASSHSYSFIFSRYIHPVAHIPKGLRVICDVDDDLDEIHSSRIKSSSSFLKAMRLRQVSWINSAAYHRLLKRLDLALFVKEENRGVKSVVVPNLPFQLLLDSSIPFQSCSARRLLFVGKLSYAPNLDGILWFLKNIWPGLREAEPSVHLTIVSNTNIANGDFYNLVGKDRGIELLINVKDLKEVYLSHAVVLAPVFQGGGSSIKVVEAFLMGRPVVTTAFGSRGIKNSEGFLFSYNSAEEFLKGVLSLLKSGEQLNELQQRIHQSAKAQYSFDAWKGKLIAELSANEKIIKD